MIRRAVTRSGALGLAMVVTLVVAACAAPAATGTPPTASASHEPAPADFPLLGAWTTTISRDDLRAGGITDPGLLNENTGTFTWVFEADGTWRSVQVSPDGAPVVNPAFEGHYTVEDRVIEAVTDFPMIYAGDVVHFEFTLAGDQVRFEVLDPPDAILPILTESRPWTRSSP